MSDDSNRPINKSEFHEALRFMHAVAAQNQERIGRVDIVLGALVDVLLKSGKLDRKRVDELIPKAATTMRDNQALGPRIEVGANEDKYEVPSPEGLPCEELLPLCLGRCCKLTFPLSFQDLDEGVVEWTYERPYRIRSRDDGYCVHSEKDTHGCGVYEQRPATCRRYDCRTDKRVWEDFDKRIPAPLSRIPAPQLRLDDESPETTEAMIPEDENGDKPA